jgi:8-oxo-dGTP pyrophosphatase MutT (NUDIX family)
VAQRTTDDQPKALKPALESMTLLVAAVIVHYKATNRVVLLQRSQNAKFAQGMWDLPVGKSEPGEPITETAVRELFEETGLTVKPEALKVAHIIRGAWGRREQCSGLVDQLLWRTREGRTFPSE